MIDKPDKPDKPAPKPPLAFPPHWRDVTVGTIIGTVGLPKPPKDKPK